MDEKDGLPGNVVVHDLNRVHSTTESNAVAESFFATLKVELVYETLFITRAQARQEIFEYIEAFYNGSSPDRVGRLSYE